MNINYTLVDNAAVILEVRNNLESKTFNLATHHLLDDLESLFINHEKYFKNTEQAQRYKYIYYQV